MKSAINPLQNNEKTHSAEVIKLQNLIELKDHKIEQKDHQLEKKEQQIDQLLDYIQLLRQKQFGASSERVSKDQINLFDEAELEQLLIELDEQLIEVDDETPSTTQVKKKKPIRRPLPADLKRVERIIDLSDTENKVWVMTGYRSALNNQSS